MKDKKKLQGFSHFILTRFNNPQWDGERFVSMYEDPKSASKWMRERIKLFRATRDSVLRQEGDFKWVLSFDENTPASDIDKIITDDRMIATTKDVRDYFATEKIDTEFVITSRMDNDDQYCEGAIKSIQDAFQPQVYLIDIDYKQWDSIDDDYYTSGNRLKHEKFRIEPTGPFLSLVEPSSDIKTCYCRPHSKLRNGYPGAKKSIASKKIMSPLALMVIHDKNMMNKVTGYPI